MLTISAMEESCAAEAITLVMHPAVRQAMRRYEESFCVGARSFLRGEADGLFFLPMRTGGYVRMLFSTRLSPRGYRILRLDPVTADGLARIKAALAEGTL